MEKKERALLSSQNKTETDLKQMQKKVANVRWPVKDEQVLEHLRLAHDEGEKRKGQRSGVTKSCKEACLVRRSLSCSLIKAWPVTPLVVGTL